MRKNHKLAAVAGCLLVCSGLASVAAAEEAGGADVEDVLVTASRLQDFNPVKITVVTADDIKATGAQNVAEALKNIPGLYVVTGGNAKGLAAAQIRGSNAENTKVFVDGVLLSQVAEAKVDLRNIPAENIAKIEVIKGAAPVIYGTDAPGGVIYITTKKASGKPAGSASIATGSYNNNILSATASGDTGKVNYYFGAKQERTDGYTAHTHEDADYFNGKVSWNLGPASSVTVFGSYAERHEQLPNRYNYLGELLAYPSGGSISVDTNHTYGTYNCFFDPFKQSYAGAVYNRKLNRDSDLSFKVYHSQETSLLRAVYTPSAKELDTYWDGKVDGCELQHVIRTSRANTVTWGAGYETKGFTETTSGAYSSLADYDYTGKSLYIQNVTKLGRKLAVNLGLRHDTITDHDTVNNSNEGLNDDHGDYTANKPVVSFNYALNGTTALHGAVGKSYRYPNGRERSGVKNVAVYDSATHESYMVPVPYLLPEEALNREMGVTYNTNSGFCIDVTGFNKDITNMIKSLNNAGTEFRDINYNIPNVNMRGYEVEVSQQIGKNIKGFFNYTYNNAYDSKMGRQVADIPLRKFAYGFNYAGQDNVNINLAVSYTGSTNSTYSNGDGNGSGEGGSKTYDPHMDASVSLPGYHVVDLKVSKEKGNREYYFRILNLLDEKYFSGADLVAAGRYIEAGTSVKF